MRNTVQYQVGVRYADGNIAGTGITGSTTACVQLRMDPGDYVWDVTAVREAPYPTVTSGTRRFRIVQESGEAQAVR